MKAFLFIIILFLLPGSAIACSDGIMLAIHDKEKDSNRYPALHMDIKLRYLKVRMVPMKDVGEPVDISNLPQDKKLVLAKMEHNRWMAEKILVGFAATEVIPDKDLQKALYTNLRLHIDIRPWEELSESDRKKDSMLTDNIQAISSKIGCKMVKMENQYLS